MTFRSVQTMAWWLLSSAAAQAAGVVLTGVTNDCVGGKHSYPAGVSIYVFDPAKSPELDNVLKELATSPEPNPDDLAAVERFFAREERLLRLVKTSKRLASTKSGPAGRFRVELPNAPDNLIVLGYAESVDGPANYASSQGKAATLSQASIVLDFTHGHCP